MHYVKSWPQYFAAVKSGEKPFELRRNDRNYQVGDSIVLQEWLPDTREYTGDRVELRITYVMNGDDTSWSDARDIPRRGLRAGFAILGFGKD